MSLSSLAAAVMGWAERVATGSWRLLPGHAMFAAALALGLASAGCPPEESGEPDLRAQCRSPRDDPSQWDWGTATPYHEPRQEILAEGPFIVTSITVHPTYLWKKKARVRGEPYLQKLSVGGSRGAGETFWVYFDPDHPETSTLRLESAGELAIAEGEHLILYGGENAQDLNVSWRGYRPY